MTRMIRGYSRHANGATVRTPIEHPFEGKEECEMSQSKEASKRKRRRKAVPVLGAAGVLSLAGGAASAATTAPTADMPSRDTAQRHVFLGEEEVADVSLATFYVFDKENAGKPQLGQKEAWWRGCGGCGRCRCGWRGCGCGGCGVGWGCCASWGRCRWC
jgi:hypothetical protein